ncbi:MAG TPA: LptA/OstA family protein [Candidatus Polarisedimenticolia bacterium]|nr:LptA/OstA family protein [Candidatus Polarisedimenticolia bacterium]
MSASGTDRVNFRPLRLITALRVVIVALLLAFGIVLFLSFGKKEEGAVRIALSRPPEVSAEQVVDLSENFDITGTKGARDAFRLKADQVTGFVGDKKLLRGVHLEVYGEDGERLALSGETGQFDMADKRAHLSGSVKLEGKNGFKLSTPSLYFDGDRDAIFTPDEIAFETDSLTGTGRGLNYLTRVRSLKIPAEVHVTVSPQEPGAEPATITSSDMTLSLNDSEAIFNESVRLVRGSESFLGNYLKLNFSSDHKRLVALKAYGNVNATILSGNPPVPATLEADSLLASFLDSGRLNRVEALGNCRVDASGIRGTSETMVADAPQDRVSLRGDPVVSDARSRIAAQEIDLSPGSHELEARGDVKTSMKGREPGSRDTPSYFSAREPIFFQAHRLTLEEGGDLARYAGSVRGWQGDDSLQAEEVILRFGDHRMKAYRNVLCRFVGNDAAAGPGTAAPSPTLIVASAMEYGEAEGVIHFRDSVKMTRAESTVTSERMHVTLNDPSEGRRKVTRILSEGDVHFTHLANTGTSDRLVYFPDQDMAEMQTDAGLAEVVDRASGRTLKGKTLQFDLKGNRVLTERSDGGRTWITLDPKKKDTPGLESKIGR